jgi:V/A-type H+-transporting ATPase subunit B
MSERSASAGPESGIRSRGGQEAIGVARIEGPILVIRNIGGIGYDEVVEIVDDQGRVRRGRVLEVGETSAVVEVFAGTTGLSIAGTRVHFQGQPLHIPVAEEMLGRIFDGLGAPIDGGPQPLPDHYARLSA